MAALLISGGWRQPLVEYCHPMQPLDSNMFAVSSFVHFAMQAKLPVMMQHKAAPWISFYQLKDLLGAGLCQQPLEQSLAL